MVKHILEAVSDVNRLLYSRSSQSLCYGSVHFEAIKWVYSISQTYLARDSWDMWVRAAYVMVV